jgi:hypothetical protein
MRRYAFNPHVTYYIPAPILCRAIISPDPSGKGQLLTVSDPTTGQEIVVHSSRWMYVGDVVCRVRNAVEPEVRISRDELAVLGRYCQTD